MHIRTFLINKQLNGRGWRISAATLARHVLSFVDRPLILKRFANGRVDHREWDSSLSASQNFADQEKYGIGRIAKILHDQTTDDYYADIEITNKHAEDWLRAQRRQNIPIAVSPQIIYDRRKEPNPHNISNWFGSHLAIVNLGAYGPSAIATNLCESAEGCPIDIQKGLDASLDFEIAAALDAALLDTSQFTSSDSVNHNKMSMIEVRPDGVQQSQQQQQQQQQQNNNNNNNNMLTPTGPKEPAYIRDSPNNRSPMPINPPIPENNTLDNQQRQDQQNKAPSEQNIDYKQLAEQFKLENDNLKTKYQDYESLHTKVNENDKEISKFKAEARERSFRDAIPVFLPEFQDKDGNVDYEKVNAEVKEYVKRNFTIDDVRKIWERSVKSWYNQEVASNNKQGGCSCGGGSSDGGGKGGNQSNTSQTTAANASIFTVPTIDDSHTVIEKPWFVDATRFMGKSTANFSKRPGRIL